jgi:hypothetical protein
MHGTQVVDVVSVPPWELGKWDGCSSHSTTAEAVIFPILQMGKPERTREAKGFIPSHTPSKWHKLRFELRSIRHKIRISEIMEIISFPSPFMCLDHNWGYVFPWA